MGQHCSEVSCKQLDYLPMKCDACSHLFCKDHLQYDDHCCTSKYKKNIQVPVCPLCNSPVPVARGTVPDLAVSAHIEADCQTSTKQKVFTNRCNKPKCKKKELVPVVCDSCRLNFCLTHRHPTDHDCKPENARKTAANAATSRISSTSGQTKISNFFSGPFKTGNTGGGRELTPAAAAALNRQSGRGTTPGRPLMAGNTSRTTGRPMVGGAASQTMTEDEALAAALAASMEDTSITAPVSGSQEEEDRLLAQALQESEELARRTAQTTGGSHDKNCTMQ